MRKKFSAKRGLVLDIIVLAAIWLTPDVPEAIMVKRIVMVILAVIAVVLIYRISRGKEIEKHTRILNVEPADQMNPAQYLSKGGPVCAGSDGRYHVTFLLENDLKLELSLSGKQAGTLAKGMCGTLVHNDNVFLSFTPEKDG